MRGVVGHAAQVSSFVGARQGMGPARRSRPRWASARWA